MKKKFSPIAILMLILVLLLCSCGTTPENENEETTIPTETVEETTEAESELDPEWLSDAAINEAYACLFPSEGEINVEKAQEILLPLVEAGNAEAQYYWGYICDLYLADNTGELEEEALYWYELSANQGFPKAYLAVAANEHLEPKEKRNEIIEMAKQAGMLSFSPEELGADGCDFVAYYYLNNNNYPSAAEWYFKAAELGSTVGMMNYGQMHYYELGVEQDYIIATDWLLKAAEAGNINAMYLYGYVLSDKEVARKLIDLEYTSSLDRYLADAQEGDPEAMYKIGVIYDYGYCGFEASRETAFEWYEKAAQAGYIEAMHAIADYYQHGYSPVEADYEIAIDWYKKAANAGDALAMYNIAHMYANGYGGDEASQETAFEWYRKAAEHGNSDGMYAMGNIYLFGTEYIKNDYSTAKLWYQRAADAGNLYAKIIILQMNGNTDAAIQNEVFLTTRIWSVNAADGYYSDYGKLLTEAMKWYEKAAAAGLADAMIEIGYYSDRPYDFMAPFKDGYSMYPEVVKAWYQKAADAGSSTAMYKLGEEYRSDNDYDAAMKYFIKAYSYGYPDAAEEIYEMLADKQGLNAYYENYEELMSANH